MSSLLILRKQIHICNIDSSASINIYPVLTNTTTGVIQSPRGVVVVAVVVVINLCKPVPISLQLN